MQELVQFGIFCDPRNYLYSHLKNSKGEDLYSTRMWSNPVDYTLLGVALGEKSPILFIWSEMLLKWHA